MMKRIVLFIGLAAVLAGVGWIVATINTMQVSARNSKFNDDIDNLFDSLFQYRDHVGSYPVGSNAEVVKALKGKNPKNVIILVGRKVELNEKGEFVDPWGSPLRIYFSDVGILVRSAGPNKRFDDSKSAMNDDYFRSN